jgi:hypothetical protein
MDSLLILLSHSLKFSRNIMGYRVTRNLAGWEADFRKLSGELGCPLYIIGVASME